MARTQLTGPQRRARLGRRIARTAYVMDSAVRVPLTGRRIGLDAVLGLVPGLGDAVGFAVSAGHVVGAARAGAPRVILLRMLANIAVDLVVGAVPLVGDLFDMAWKANERNAALVTAWVASPRITERTSRRLAATVAFAVAVLVTASFAAGAWLLAWLVL